MKRIGIANDHSAVELKQEIKAYVEAKGYEVVDYGTNSSESINYPMVGYPTCVDVANNTLDGAILICGTGVGMSLVANKVKGIRAVVCSEPYSAQLSKQHNNSNVLCFGARVVGSELAKMIVDAWLDAEFMGGRHANRVEMITQIENGTFKAE